MSEAVASDEDRTLKARYEMKHLVREDVAFAIERHVGTILPLDRYSGKSPDGLYTIASLYVDSKDLRLYRDTVEGRAVRFKLRVRAYSDEPSSPCFFEIKQRSNSIITKTRARADRKAAERILASAAAPSGLVGPRDEEAMRAFKVRQVSVAADPVLLVRYRRKAYEDEGPNRLRITLDRDIRYAAWREPTVRLEGPRWEAVPLGWVVLEIKFTGRFPSWLMDLTARFGLRQQSVCKYALSVRHAAGSGRIGGSR